MANDDTIKRLLERQRETLAEENRLAQQVTEEARRLRVAREKAADEWTRAEPILRQTLSRLNDRFREVALQVAWVELKQDADDLAIAHFGIGLSPGSRGADHGYLLVFEILANGNVEADLTHIRDKDAPPAQSWSKPISEADAPFFEETVLALLEAATTRS